MSPNTPLLSTEVQQNAWVCGEEHFGPAKSAWQTRLQACTRCNGAVVSARSCGGAERQARALDAAAAAAAAGDNGRGQLGVSQGGSNILHPLSISVVGRWAAIALSDSHAAGLSCDGQLYTWGNNNRGQLGLGDKSPGVVDIPVALQALADLDVKCVCWWGWGCCGHANACQPLQRSSSWGTQLSGCAQAPARPASVLHAF